MPLLLALALIVAAFVLAVVMVPFALVFRYRYGTRRRRARVWVATLNAASLALSATILLISAAITTRFLPYSFTAGTAGLACGAVLGLLGLALTRWERDGPSLFYTPSRLLVLAVTLVVTLRIGYGFWRGWHTWRAAQDGRRGSPRSASRARSPRARSSSATTSSTGPACDRARYASLVETSAVAPFRPHRSALTSRPLSSQMRRVLHILFPHAPGAQ